MLNGCLWNWNRRNLIQSRNGSPRENFQMRPLQLKISPPQGGWSGETELEYKKQSRNGSPRENFQMRPLQLKISPPQGGWSGETELE